MRRVAAGAARSSLADARGSFVRGDESGPWQSRALSIPIGDRSERRGSITLVLLVAAGLIAAAAGLMFVGRGQAGSYVIVLLALLAVIGVFSLLALAAGVLRISGRDSGQPRCWQTCWKTPMTASS